MSTIRSIPRRAGPRLLAVLAPLLQTRQHPGQSVANMQSTQSSHAQAPTGDVMLGRGVDQVLPHHCPPHLYEECIADAREYTLLAIRQNGPLPPNRGYDYPWGYALQQMALKTPDVRLINLETAATLSGDAWRDKGIHYRMHPRNAEALRAAGVDVASLANNHVLDWGFEGLHETLKSVRAAGVLPVGAGADQAEAEAPAVVEVPGKGRVIVLAVGHWSSGVPGQWAAGPRRAGVATIKLDKGGVGKLAEQVQRVKLPGDVVVLSIHWGGNWGFEVPAEQAAFAHHVIDEAGVDVVHGHSSHHPKGLEVYKGKLILYGCGDFISDYEGINSETYQEAGFRDDISLGYYAEIDCSTGKLTRLQMVPARICHLSLAKPRTADIEWACETMNRECWLLTGLAVKYVDGRANELELQLQSQAGPAKPGV
ncbi:hypothetical protein WJX72_008701 [[Myrmecia] bisecta]|uniref:Capsule synthesis protein CapA domain-containing protein n=1 Tax=[Myrmecia] bisecta TaxID=41462 RepID=A0AAW1PA94_9CHLO